MKKQIALTAILTASLAFTAVAQEPKTDVKMTDDYKAKVIHQKGE